MVNHLFKSLRVKTGAKNEHKPFYSQAFRGQLQDIPAKNPGISRQKVWIPCGSRDIPNFPPPLYVEDLWSGRPPNSTEAQKELKWPKSDSKVTFGVPPPSDPKCLKSDSKMTQK